MKLNYFCLSLLLTVTFGVEPRQTSAQVLQGAIDVQVHGIKGDNTPCSDKLQTLLNTLQHEARDRASIIYFPPGWYRLDKTVTVNANNLIIVGAGAQYQPSDGGTWFEMTDREQNPAILIKGRGVRIQDVGFYTGVNTEVSEWEKKGGPPSEATAIKIEQTTGTTLRDLFFLDTYTSIDVSEAGSIKIDRIRGEPLRYGIRMRSSGQMSQVNGVEFWRFASGPGREIISMWKRENGEAFHLDGVDGIQLDNTFSIGYRYGFRFEGRATKKFVISNSYIDECVEGIEIRSAKSYGFLSNITCSGDDGLEEHLWRQAAGLEIDADEVKVWASNVQFDSATKESDGKLQPFAIYVEGEKSMFSASNLVANYTDYPMFVSSQSKAVIAAGSLLEKDGTQLLTESLLPKGR